MADIYEGGDLMLEEEVDVRKFVEGGATFTLKSNFQKTDDDDELFPELMTGEEGINLDNDVILSPWDKPFAELTSMMTDIGHSIYKKVVKQPLDDVVMNGRCRVSIDYNAYHEQVATPYDSTFMRGTHFTFVTNDGAVLPGLELAVQSMKRGEEAQFVIPYDLLYGKHGCEPRIKKEADSLFVIQLIKFFEIGDEDATENVDNEDKRKFHVMVDKIIEVKASGVDYFRQGSYVKAAAAFHRAINRLQMCQLANEEEERQQQQHLKTLYTNAMTCYNKMGNPKKVCSAFNELSKLTDTDQHTKALFAYGKALLTLGEFGRARVALKKAYRLKPNDSDIVQQLKLLDRKHKDFKDTESNLWRKAFGNDDPIALQESDDGVSESYKAAVNDLVTEFRNNRDESKKNLPNLLRENEMAYIRDLIKDMQMKLVIPEVQGSKSCYLIKM